MYMQLNQSYQKLTGTGETTYMSHHQKKGRGQDSQKIKYEGKLSRRQYIKLKAAYLWG